MPEQRRIDPSDGLAYTWTDMCNFYGDDYTLAAIKAYWASCKVYKKRNIEARPDTACRTAASRRNLAVLRSPQLVIEAGTPFNLLDETHLSREQLDKILNIEQHGSFRWWAGRSMLDFKCHASKKLRLDYPYDVLNPLVKVLTAFAKRTLQHGEELALMQLLVNYYADGSNAVRAHRHRCRQICASLGAERNVEVEGKLICMAHGDCLYLSGEEHSVPAAEKSILPRMSVCLFYASADECDAGSVSVLANGSFWWIHPDDK